MSAATFTAKQRAERDELALFCTYEIESIGMHLRAHLPTEPEYLFLRSMVLRVIELNSAAMSVLGGEDDRTTEELRRVLEMNQ